MLIVSFAGEFKEIDFEAKEEKNEDNLEAVQA
jgi:hypothetical protein